MARLAYWLMNGAIHLDTDPLHARIYYDPVISTKDYIRDAVNPRSDAINLGPRAWVFNDPAGDGSGPGWGLSFVNNPTNFLFTNYNLAQLGSHTVAVYNPSNQVIVATKPLGFFTQEARVDHYARTLHVDPALVMQEVGGSDQHPYNALAMYMAGQINWPAIPAVISLLNADLFTINRTVVKYTSSIFQIPFAAIISERYAPGKSVTQDGYGLSTATMFDGIPAGFNIAGYALYNQATGEIIRLQNFQVPLTTVGTEPVWVTDMRLVMGYN